MAINACAELFWVLLANLVNYVITEPIYVIPILIIFGTISKKLGPLIIGLIAFIANSIIDFIFAGTAGLSIPLTILGSIAIGILWSMMALSSPVSPLIKIPNAFLLFIFGFIWGIVPIPIPIFLAIVVGWLIENVKIMSYLIGIISAVALFSLIYVAGPTFSYICEGIGYAVTLF